MRKYPDIDWSPEKPLSAKAARRALAAGTSLDRNPASRFAFVRQDGDALLLFVDGAAYACTGPAAALAERLCAGPTIAIDAAAQSDAVVDLVAALVNGGSVELDRSA